MFTKKNYFLADLHNYTTPFVSALGNTIAKRLPQGGGYKYHSHAAGLGKRLHHGDPSVFLMYRRVGADVLYVGVLRIHLVQLAIHPSFRPAQ